MTPWTTLARATEHVGRVFVLAPASAADQLLPGLWLDEKAIITGASASQLAYEQIAARQDAATADVPPLPDLMTAALWLDTFPRELAVLLPKTPVGDTWVDAAPIEDKAAWLITVSNLLATDSVRVSFQRDPLVVAARAAIPEFGESAFGPKSSVVWRRELAGAPAPPPEREAYAVPEGTPRAHWLWTTVAGLGFKDSAADVRPGDPPLEFRFAFTWDATALHLHAEVMDTPPGFAFPPDRRRRVELFIDPANDGLAWGGAGDFQFLYPLDMPVREMFHDAPAAGRLQLTPTGYTVEAAIPWRELGIVPHTGLALRISPAVVSDGRHEWEPNLKLTWRYFLRDDEKADLGWLRLQ